jgi:hypothetical protein
MRQAFRGVVETIRAAQQRQGEAVSMGNVSGRATPAGDDFARKAADEWRANLRAMRQAAGPQGRTGCGVLDDFGNCRNRTHTLKCAESITSAANRATFAPQGTAESDRLWIAA